ncbi:MAG: tetratricopeptide repeat protein [Burkholderiaceae bacterium]
MARALRFDGRPAAEAYYRGQWESARTTADTSSQWRSLDNLLTVLQALGRPGEVLALGNECERLAGGRAPPDAMARCLNHRAAARLATGALTQAAADFEAAGQRLQALLTKADDTFTALVRTNLAVAWRRLGRLDAALHWHERSLPILRLTLRHGPDARLADAVDAYGSALREAGRFEDAGRELEAALAMRRQLHPDGLHPSIAASLGNLAILRLATGQADEALLLTERSLAIWQTAYPGHDDTDIATGLVRLGDIHERAARLPEARQALRRALAMIGRLGDDAPATLRAAALTGLARVAAAGGDTGEAQQRAGQAVAALQAQAGSDSPVSTELLLALDARAAIAYRAGRFDAAATAYRDLGSALQRRGDASPAGIARRANALNNLGLAERARGRPARAVAAHEEALALRRSLRAGGAQWAVAQSEANLGRALIDAGQLPRARAHLSAALALHQRAAAPGSVATGREAEQSAVLTALALLDERAGRWDDALRSSEQALALQRRLRGPADHPAIADGLAIRGRLLAAAGQVPAAWAIQQQALAMMARVHPQTGHPEWADALEEAARTLRVLGDLARAERLAGRAAAMRQRLAAR